MQAILDLLNLVTTVWGKHRAALPKHWPWWSRWGHFWYCWESHWKAELCCYEFHTNRATFLQYLISNIFSARYHIVAVLPQTIRCRMALQCQTLKKMVTDTPAAILPKYVIVPDLLRYCFIYIWISPNLLEFGFLWKDGRGRRSSDTWYEYAM